MENTEMNRMGHVMRVKSLPQTVIEERLIDSV